MASELEEHAATTGGTAEGRASLTVPATVALPGSVRGAAPGESVRVAAKAYKDGHGEVPTAEEVLDVLDLWRWRELRGQPRSAYLKRVLDIVAPCNWWIQAYTFKDFRLDLAAGITVALILIPQGMGYAKNAGLPPVFGLYASCTPLFIYAWFGTSRQLSVGPVAVLSQIVGTGIAAIIDPTKFKGAANAAAQLQYNNYVMFTMALMGIFQFLLGFLKLGHFTNFLSVPTLMGFTAGAATTNGWGQLKDLLGYKQDTYLKVGLAADSQPINTYFGNMQFANPTTAALGVSYFVILEGLKLVGNVGARRTDGLKYLFFVKQAGPFLVLAAAMLITWTQGLDRACPTGYTYPYPAFPQPCGVTIIGKNPPGIPGPVFPWAAATPDGFSAVVTTAVVCAFVGFLESISIDRALAMQTGFKRADPSQELMALGFANFFGSIFSGYPVTGSFSRSSVKAQIGARTQAAGLIVAVVMCFVLTFLTGLLTYIPNNVIAAIIISALLGLFDLHAVWRTFKTDKRDFALWLLTYLAVILLGIELGIAFSVGLSLLLLVYNAWIPHAATLGRIPGTPIYRSVDQYPEARRNTHPGILVVRIDAPLWFANSATVKAIIDAKVWKQEKEEGARVRWVVWEMTPVSHVDTTGTQEIAYMLKDFALAGVQLVLSNPHGNVLRTLERAGLVGRTWGLSYDAPAQSLESDASAWGDLPLVSGAVPRQWVFASSSEAVATVLKAKADGYEPSVQAHTFTDVFGNLVATENAANAAANVSAAKWEDVPCGVGLANMPAGPAGR